MSNVTHRGPKMNRSTRWALFAVTLTYVTVTVAESILAPILPLASGALSLSPVDGSRVLAILSMGTAIGNLAGGFLLGRLGVKATSMIGVGLTSSGGLIAVLPGDFSLFVVAHALIGLGAGGFFASGIYAVGKLADPTRRGTAMGMFGIAFSLALALAAGLVALAGPDIWRHVFLVAVGFGLVSLISLWSAELPGPSHVVGLGRGPLGVLIVPVAVGGIAAIAQFGLVVFIPTIAVDGWAMTAAAGATVLLVGRILSIPGKAVAGRLVDRLGAISAARILGAALFGSGVIWLAVPWIPAAAAAAAVFAAGASAMFPVANVIAVEEFGERGGLLGVFRSLQMGIAGVSVWLVGLGATVVGLERALLIGVFSLLAIMAVRRSR